ncbi:MAG: DUF1631 family protein [Candidatus Thiodiazotropha sp.]
MSDENRRRHPRLDIDMPAVIEYQNRTYSGCRLLNFSLGGAYLESTDEGLKASLPDGYFAEYERQEARLSLPSESLKVRVSVVYFHGDGLGLAFLDAAGGRLFEMLQARQQAQHGHPQRKPEGQVLDSASLHKLLDRLWEQARRFLEDGLPSFFAKAARELQHLITQSGDPRENSVLFYALNSLEQDRVEVLQRFIERSAADFAQLTGEAREAPLQAADEPAELALVEKQEIDTWILLNDVARRAETEVSRTLYRFESALSYLCRDNIHNELNPLAPISLLTTLKSLLDDYELDRVSVRVILLIYNQFNSRQSTGNQ